MNHDCKAADCNNSVAINAYAEAPSSTVTLLTKRTTVVSAARFKIVAKSHVLIDAALLRTILSYRVSCYIRQIIPVLLYYPVNHTGRLANAARLVKASAVSPAEGKIPQPG